MVALQGAGLSFGGAPLFKDVDLALAPGQRACLVGRNGSGKSTLMALLAGTVAAHFGERYEAPGTRIGFLAQDPVLDPDTTVKAYVGADGVADHEAADIIGRLEIDGDAVLGTLSGGERRRTCLARVLAGKPDVLLVDEPTNHLDLPTILWLEGLLTAHRGGLLLISHDRAFLAAVSNHMYWLDTGGPETRLRSRAAGYAEFEAWRDDIDRERESAGRKLSQALKAEEHWLVHGVTARRRRNQGRLAKLQEMRETRRRVLAGGRLLKLESGPVMASGRLAVDADNISKAFGERVVIDGFSTRVLRGDRIGIVGGNGSGKTTLVNLLTGKLKPDSGKVKLGSRLEITTFAQQAGFDAARGGFDPEKTLWQTLVPGGGDSLMVQGAQRHVVGYLRDFLFDERQATAPVKTLSGGERNRLKLAQILAAPSNMMVLDEPTNDLDADTLDLLQEMIAAYEGTVLLVSHDRDFLENTVSSVMVLDGAGGVDETAGGYGDAAPRMAPARGKKRAPGGEKRADRPRPPTTAAKMTYKETRELAALPETMARLTAAKEKLEAVLADPATHVEDPDGARAMAAKLSDVSTALAAAEDRWLTLEARREALEGTP